MSTSGSWCSLPDSFLTPGDSRCGFQGARAKVWVRGYRSFVIRITRPFTLKQRSFTVGCKGLVAEGLATEIADGLSPPTVPTFREF